MNVKKLFVLFLLLSLSQEITAGVIDKMVISILGIVATYIIVEQKITNNLLARRIEFIEYNNSTIDNDKEYKARLTSIANRLIRLETNVQDHWQTDDSNEDVETIGRLDSITERMTNIFDYINKIIFKGGYKKREDGKESFAGEHGIVNAIDLIAKDLAIVHEVLNENLEPDAKDITERLGEMAKNGSFVKQSSRRQLQMMTIGKASGKRILAQLKLQNNK